jgi:hypothetical protein
LLPSKRGADQLLAILVQQVERVLVSAR